MTELDYDAIKARLEKTTPGPWQHGYADESGRASDEGGATLVRAVDDDATIVRGGSDDYTVNYGVLNEGDAEFIAHAREDVPALLDRIEVLEGENLELRTERAPEMLCPACGYDSRNPNQLGDLASDA